MVMLKVCRFEIDDALDQQVLGIFLSTCLPLNAVNQMLKNYVKQLLCKWIPEEAFELEVDGSAQFD